VPLLPRPEEIGIDAFREQSVVAWEALLGGRGDLLVCREQFVGAAEQALAAALRRKIGDALDRKEAGYCQRSRVAQGQVGKAR